MSHSPFLMAVYTVPFIVPVESLDVESAGASLRPLDHIHTSSLPHLSEPMVCRSELLNAHDVATFRLSSQFCDWSVCSTSAMRSPARPSHNGGTVPFLGRPAIIFDNSEPSLSLSCPTTILVPKVTVTGRSVLSRTVRHGTPK